MNVHITHGCFLRNALACIGVFLTLMNVESAQAFERDGSQNDSRDSPLVSQENNRRGDQALGALQKQVLGVLPGDWVKERLGLDFDRGDDSLRLAPDYHHKGFMNDAVVMGVSARQNVWEDKAQVEVRPFWGQNWHSSDNYWGAEVALNLGQQKFSWGRIAVRYTQGDESLIDRGQGFDMHGEMNFTDHLSLHTGVRENGNSDLGNYVLVKWKLTH